MLTPTDALKWLQVLVPSAAVVISLLAFVGLILLVSFLVAPVKLMNESRGRQTGGETGLLACVTILWKMFGGILGQSCCILAIG